MLVGADRFGGSEYGFLASALGFPFTYMLSIAHLIFSGTLDRFPTLKFGFFEAGAGWLPYLLNRLDIYHAAETPSVAQSKAAALQSKPSQYVHQLHMTIHTAEPYLGDVVRMVPDHRFMLGSDFHHRDPNGLWPSAIPDLMAMPGLSGADKQRILETNPREFLGL